LLNGKWVEPQGEVKATHTLVEQYIKNETPSIRAVLPLGLFKLLKPYIDQIDNIHLLEAIMFSINLQLLVK